MPEESGFNWRPPLRGATIIQDPAQPGPAARGKVYPSPQAALSDVFDGAVLLVAGFAGCGWPGSLIGALRDGGASNLTIICQGAWSSPSGAERGAEAIASLLTGGQVSKLVSPLPFLPSDGGALPNSAVEARWKSGSLEIEVVPQGVLAERLRAGGAGLGGVFIPTGVGTRFGAGKELRQFGGKDHLFEPALRADFALLRGYAADSLGNLVYRGAQRNWNPVMAMAGAISIAEVDEVFEPGGLDPELVITPGIFVNRIVQTV